MAREAKGKAGSKPRKGEHSTLKVVLPVPLTKEQKVVFDGAVRRMSATEDEVADALRDLGVWLLFEVFKDDTRTALGLDRRTNPVWREILRRAGSETIKFGEQMLRNVLRCAAWDHRIANDEFRHLDLGRKTLLLPLNNGTLLRKAAQHVSRTNLTHDATVAYVATVLEKKSGAEPDVRVSVPRVKADLRRIRDRYASAAFRKRLAAALAKLDPAERAQVLADLEATRNDLGVLLDALQKR